MVKSSHYKTIAIFTQWQAGIFCLVRKSFPVNPHISQISVDFEDRREKLESAVDTGKRTKRDSDAVGSVLNCFAADRLLDMWARFLSCNGLNFSDKASILFFFCRFVTLRFSG